jgi:hypothetical protein
VTNAPKNRGLDGRAREKTGQIDHKHPTTKIKHLREHYGSDFAREWDGERTLGELLKETKFESLTQYVKHHGHQPVPLNWSSSRTGSETPQASFRISFDPDLSPDHIKNVLSALADYYRECGGVGLQVNSIELAVPAGRHTLA